MSTQAGLMTVEEFLKLPDPPGGYYELVHGEVELMPFPKRGHQRRQSRIHILLWRLAGEKGEVGTEYAFRPTLEYNMWQADVAFVRAEREDAVGRHEYLMGAPDLVVEVLSPSNTPSAIRERRRVCIENGCSSFWVVDDDDQHVTVTEGGVTSEYGITSSFFCAVLDATIQVREIFE
jgi:Uma2 family endonuclease